MPNSASLPDHEHRRLGGLSLSSEPNESHFTSAKVEVQRVSVGSGTGYAIIVGGYWLGTLTGADAQAFRAAYGALRNKAAHNYLADVALKMAVTLNAEIAGAALSGAAS